MQKKLKISSMYCKLKEPWFVTSALEERNELEAACEPLMWAGGAWRRRFTTCSSSSVHLSSQCLCFSTHFSLFFPTLFQGLQSNTRILVSYFWFYPFLSPLHSMIEVKNVAANNFSKRCWDRRAKDWGSTLNLSWYIKEPNEWPQPKMTATSPESVCSSNRRFH